MNSGILLAVIAIGLAACPEMSRAQPLIERVSEDDQGANRAEGLSDSPALNADGGFAAFFSEAPGLVLGDQNGLSDVFVRDRTLGQTERVSMGADGTESNAASELGGFSPAISADGRFVAFSSAASNLVSDDTKGAEDVFVYNRSERVTERVSVGIDDEANGSSGFAAISQDGRYVVFESLASNLVEDDSNEVIDIFLFGPVVFQHSPPPKAPTRKDAHHWPYRCLSLICCKCHYRQRSSSSITRFFISTMNEDIHSMSALGQGPSWARTERAMITTHFSTSSASSCSIASSSTRPWASTSHVKSPASSAMNCRLILAPFLAFTVLPAVAHRRSGDPNARRQGTPQRGERLNLLTEPVGLTLYGVKFHVTMLRKLKQIGVYDKKITRPRV